MEVMTKTNVIEGAYGGARANAGVPSNGTSAIQTGTIGGTPTAGSIAFQSTNGIISGSALWSATNNTLIAHIQAVLDALLGTDEVLVAVGTMTAGIGTFTVTFQNNSAAKVQPLLTGINNLTGTSPTFSMATTTPGVNATHRGAPKGGMVQDQTNGNVYVNHGTQTAPTWQEVTQS